MGRDRLSSLDSRRGLRQPEAVDRSGGTNAGSEEHSPRSMKHKTEEDWRWAVGR
jgi:hypothetical protein